MRVAVIGPISSDTFADNVADTLARMGHEVLQAGGARKKLRNQRVANAAAVFSEKLPKLDALQQRHLVPLLKEFAPHATITVDRRLLAPTVATLREIAPIALWFPDAVSTMGRHEMFLAPYSRLYLKNPTLVARLRDIYGLNVDYLPEAANSSWHLPQVSYGSDQSIIMAGNLHPTRAKLIERLVGRGVPVHSYGARMPRWVGVTAAAETHTGRYLARQEKANVFRSARGVLNNLHPAEYSGSNCRMFEAAGSGGVLLTEWRDGMDALYQRDHEVLGFDSFDDLVQHCVQLLDDIEFGRALGDRAAARTVAEHTYEHRLSRILGDLIPADSLPIGIP